MANTTWRERLKAAIERKGRSNRDVSLATGHSPGYLHGVLVNGKEPGVDSLVKVCAEVGVSLTEIVFGAEMSPETEKLLKLFAGLTDDQKADFLRIAESVSTLAGRTAQ